MERQQCNTLQNFSESKTEILKKRLLKSANITQKINPSQNNLHQNVLLNTLRAPIPSSMIVSSVQASQNSMPITHNLLTHSIAPVKIHTSNSPYPLQLSTVHVPVQIPGSNSNINVPVQLTGQTSMPLQITPVSLPIQVSGTTSVPVQLPAGETINVPLQIPTAGQNIQLATSALPSMPLLQNATQPLSSIFHVHMGTNQRPSNIDGSSDMVVSNSMNNATTVTQVGSNSIVQIPNSSNNSIQLTLPSSSNTGTVQLRGAARPMPHVVYIQTPTGLKPVASSDVITQASTSGNPPQIIVRRPTGNSANIHLISNMNKTNIAPKIPGQNKCSILAPGNATQPIVIQKPKSTDKVIVPVSIASGTQGKQAIAYLSSVKKTNNKNIAENQSILISNNQSNVQSVGSNQKLFLTPMNMPKIQNTKFILPVSLPATMASKGPIINLQIANGQIQNDPQGNITVMRDTGPMEASEMPPLQPFGKLVNGKEEGGKAEKTFTISIPGSRAEPTGEQGEYTLSIPETNAAMNDDIYTVSIADDDGGQSNEKSFTLAIPEKGKSLLNRNMIDRNDINPVAIAAPAILRRSNSDNSERKIANANLKRRISLCNESYSNRNGKIPLFHQKTPEKRDWKKNHERNDDHRVPSLFCDEKLEKDLEVKTNMADLESEDGDKNSINKKDMHYFMNDEDFDETVAKRTKRERDSTDSIVEEDPPGLLWNNGVAQLQGSLLQFQTNEFGMIDLIDNSENNDEPVNTNAKYHTPLKQRMERNSRDKKPTSPEDLYRCDGCGCHGMAAEFITPNFCSLTCQSEVQKSVQIKKNRERIEILKKRNKMKKILMRKQLSESDAQETEKVPLKHFDSAPTDSQISETALLKMTEDLVENEKYPWMCGKNGFSWMRYLDICKAKAAPVKLFKDPFPYNRNGFKVGMRMEAIDPHHPALFCVVSVAEVQGFRMRLHFDEYPDVYDYWVNADCVDIYPVGWCEKNGRSLRPPEGHSTENFSWPMYLKQIRAVAAPRQLFTHINSMSIKPNGFRIGMKLEAEDRKNELLCVATIADMLDNRILINFDSWDDMYDFWVDPTSPYIHPVGWAEENGIPLTPPNFYKDPDSFSWENYLNETNATAAPPRAFKARPPQGFKPGMKLEVVDKRVPFLIRVATINAVKAHQVRISYDGWPEQYSHWLDDDSPDIHPVGWCLKTGHPLEPPMTAEELTISGACGVAGCRGLGSLQGGAHKQHAAATLCPYRATPAGEPADRLSPRQHDGLHVLPKARRVSKAPKSIHTSTPTSDTGKERQGRGRPPKHKRVEEVSKHEAASDEESVASGTEWRRSQGAAAPPRAPPACTQVLAHVRALRLSDDPTVWTQSETTSLIVRIVGPKWSNYISEARVSGPELLMASCSELASALKLRLGPAVRLYAAVRALREQVVCMN